jgi:flagellar basal body-associated protein FliL
MSDEEGLSLEDVGAGAEEIAPAGRKAGFLSAVLVRALKWVAIGLGFVILGVTTTVITFNLVNRGRAGSEVRELSPEYSARPDPLNYDDTLEEIRGVTSDETPAIFSARISLGYDPGNQQLAIEIAARRREIGNIVLLYLSNKSSAELRPEHYLQIQEDLRGQINRVLKEGQIESVVFRDFVVTQ